MAAVLSGWSLMEEVHLGIYTKSKERLADLITKGKLIKLASSMSDEGGN